MKFELNKNSGECVEMPVLVLNKLTQATEGAVRTALYIVYNNTTEVDKISSALGLSVQEIETALIFWLGAGLLSSRDVDKDANKNSENQIKKRPPRLTQREVVAASQKNPEIAILMEECQNLFGEVISPSDAAILVSLYVSDNLPVDFILTGISHFLQIDKRSVRYIERRLLSWQKDGIDTCEAIERHLSLLEMRSIREQSVAELLEISPAAFTAPERTRIASWYEDFAYGDDMIEQAFLRTGANKTIKYMNGILRKWHAENIRTPKDIPKQPQNLVTSSVTKHHSDDYVAKKMYHVPTLKRGGKGNG